MNAELHDAWQRFRDDDDAFVLVITGAGDAFCAGWDLADAARVAAARDFDEFRRDLYDSPGVCGYTRRVDVFKPVIAAVNGWAVAAGLETALLADIRIAARSAVFGALERRWNIVAGDGLTVRLPLVVGYAKAMELIITGRRRRRRGGAADRARERGRPARRRARRARSSSHTRSPRCRRARSAPTRRRVMRNVGRTLEERLRNEAEATMSMFLRRDSHRQRSRRLQGAHTTPSWPHHGL